MIMMRAMLLGWNKVQIFLRSFPKKKAISLHGPPGVGKGFLKDQEGNVVRSRLIEPMLQKIAMETNGMYVRASGAHLGLDLMYQEELSKLQKQEA